MSRKKNTKIIAITLQKGGSGKSAVSVNLAAYLSILRPTKNSKRYKVLVVDGDVHATATHYFNLYDETDLGFYDVLAGNCEFDDAIKTVDYEYGKAGGTCYIDIIPSFKHLHTIEEEWLHYDDPKNLFANSIAKSKKIHEYDFVIVDCPSEGDCLLSNIYNVCDYYIIPLFAETESFRNLGITYEQVNELSTNGRKKNFLGCIINNFKRTDLSLEYQEKIMSIDYINCFNTVIPYSTRYDESSLFQMPIPFYHRNVRNMERINRAFKSFAVEVVDLLKNNQF